jgi:hypothetical protein
MCLYSNSTGAGLVSSDTCDNGSDQDWEFQSRTVTGTTLPVVKLRNVRYNLCLDSGNGTTSDWGATTKACNTGNYQLWELHRNGNYYVLKSWGRWKHNGIHMCLADEAPWNTSLEPCAKTTAPQNWTRKTS